MDATQEQCSQGVTRKGAAAANQEPKSGILQDAARVAREDCSGTSKTGAGLHSHGSGGLLIAQAKTAIAQVWKRNGPLVRSVLAMVYTGMC